MKKSILFPIRAKDLFMLYAEITESSLKTVFDLHINRFESIRLDRRMFSVRGRFI